MSEAEPIVLDHTAWTQQDLLLHIIHRYFDLGDEVMSRQAWEVRAKSGRTDSEALIQPVSYTHQTLPTINWV